MLRVPRRAKKPVHGRPPPDGGGILAGRDRQVGTKPVDRMRVRQPLGVVCGQEEVEWAAGRGARARRYPRPSQLKWITATLQSVGLPPKDVQSQEADEADRAIDKEHVHVLVRVAALPANTQNT